MQINQDILGFIVWGVSNILWHLLKSFVSINCTYEHVYCGVITHTGTSVLFRLSPLIGLPMPLQYHCSTFTSASSSFHTRERACDACFSVAGLLH